MSLKKNVAWLLCAQVFNYAIPLLQLPYLGRVLSDDMFGVIMLSMSLIAFSHIVTEFGFDLYLYKRISSKTNSSKLSRIFSSNVLIKSVIGVITTLVVFVILVNSKIEVDCSYIALVCVSIFINSFSISWLFNCTERNYAVSAITIVSKILSLVLVVLLIDRDHDINRYGFVLIMSSSIIVALSYYYANKVMGVSFTKPSLKLSKIMTVNSINYFTSKLCGSFITNGCVVYLGITASTIDVASFSYAERLYSASSGLFYPLITAITPYLCRTLNIRTHVKFFSIMILSSISILSISVLFGSELLSLVFGNSSLHSVEVLHVLMIALVVYAINSSIGYPLLIPCGLGKTASVSSLFGATVLLIALFTYNLIIDDVSPLDVAFIFVISHTTMLMHRLYSVIKNRHVIFFKFKMGI